MRRKDHKEPGLTFDFISAFTLTAGFTNHFSTDLIDPLKEGEYNVPLYYFGDFTFPALQNPYRYSFSVGTNIIFTTDRNKTAQRVGFFNVHLNHVQISYYNDGGTPFDDSYLGDGKDRYYTGGALFSYHGKPYTAINLIELSFHKFTGYTKNAFEVSNKLDLAYVNYKNKEEKYYNKSMWTLNISNPAKGFGINIHRYNYTKWDVQHLIHFSIFNSYHLVPYDDYFSVSGIYYHTNTNIGLK